VVTVKRSSELDDTVAATPTETPAGATTAETWSDTQLIAGRYKITRYLGGGGMGNVYAADDTELGEPVAVKVLRRGLVDDAVSRFRREVRLQRRITHRNVARIFDIGEHDGEKLLTMELIDGESLAARLARDTRLSPSRLAAIAADLLAGLSAAHAAGVLHLDLKPANVLLASDGRAVIADFGVARAGRGDATEIVVGTPSYMAPEQHAGDELDAGADIYAFGAMLFEMAVGRKPFDGETPMKILHAKLSRDPVTAAGADLPPPLGAVIRRCLAPERADRYADADELAAALAVAVDPAATTGTQRAVARAAPRVSVAVLPVSAASADAYLGDGLAEDLADVLSRSPGLRVLPATAARQFADDAARHAGERLGVDHVVESSLRRIPEVGTDEAGGRRSSSRAGDRLRVAIRLIAVRDGFQVWAERRDTAESELLATCDELAAALAAALSTVAVRRDEIDPRAVELYLRARHLLRDFWGKGIVEAIDLLEDARRTAPSPALLSTLAHARVRAWMMRGTVGQPDEVRDAVERAMAAGPELGEARYARALYRLNTNNPIAGMADLGAAIARSPLLPEAHASAGLVLSEIGELDEGRRRFAHAGDIDPAYRPLVGCECARLDALLGNWDDATAALAAIRATAPRAIANMALIFESRLAMWRRGRDAIVDAPDLTSLSGMASVEHVLAMVLEIQRTGGLAIERWRAAMATIDVPHAPLRGRLVGRQALIEIAVEAGHRDDAIAAIEQLARDGLLDRTWIAYCPSLRAVRDDPAVASALAVVSERAEQALEAYRDGLSGRA
jgi:serine/threonine-protein kinase